jgi:hypothetical protein
MASADNAENTTAMHDLKTDPEGAREPIPSDKHGDVKKLEDAGPPDGGMAAWLVVLGAWCCSFSSPGWINSTNLLSSQCIEQRRYGLTAILFYQAWAASSSITRLDR